MFGSHSGYLLCNFTCFKILKDHCGTAGQSIGPPDWHAWCKGYKKLVKIGILHPHNIGKQEKNGKRINPCPYLHVEARNMIKSAEVLIATIYFHLIIWDRLLCSNSKVFLAETNWVTSVAIWDNRLLRRYNAVVCSERSLSFKVIF